MTSPESPGTDDLPRDVYTVSALNLEARALLEGHFPPVWVEGELSNLARPRSGHMYFSLKDEHCQVRCAMFRTQNRRLEFEPADGMQVLVNARVGLYPERGEFQLLAQYMEEAGAGALRRAFDALKTKLAAEGLFDAGSKRPLPALPRAVGLVTSPTGAAIRDALSVLARRFPAIEVVVYPVPVQGAGSAEAIARMLELAAGRGECDALLLVRGGGSLEDLWAFNEEVLARAVHRCPVPVITGIGHEVDFTIADFVADHRAPTPSAAAELVSPDAAEWRERIGALERRIATLARASLGEARRRLDWLGRRLVHPSRRLFDGYQRLDELRGRLERGMRSAVDLRGASLRTSAARLTAHHPAARLQTLRMRHDQAHRRLAASTGQRLAQARAGADALARALEAVGPGATLARGYAIVTRERDGAVIRDAIQVSAGERIQAHLARGRLDALVESASEPDQ